MRPYVVFLALAALCIATGCGGCSGPPQGLSEEEIPAEPFSDEAVNFLVVGDWGRNGFFNQREVGVQMGRTAQEIDSRFVISTGDNFYSAGVTSLTDPKWRRSFEDVYTASSLQTPWYVVLGNHDWQGDIGAQIEYTRRSDRWTMPSRYFTHEVSLNDSTQALFVYIDTTPLADPDRAYLYPQSEALWDRSTQLAWIDSTLASSEATWKIVVGHHPLYSASSKVSYQRNEYLISDLEPIMERHGVQVYFAGHDHNLQHLHPEATPVQHFVSGGGSLTRGIDTSVEEALFALRVAGFMAVSLTATQMYVQAIGENGNVYYFANVPVGEQATEPKASPDASVPSAPSGLTPEAP